jgi:hypothetical protein
VATRNMLTRCRPHLQRMHDPRPEARFETLQAAANAVAACWPSRLPERSMQPWPVIPAKYLIWDVRGATDPDPSPSEPQWATSDGTVFPFGEPFVAPPEDRPRQIREAAQSVFDAFRQ